MGEWQLLHDSGEPVLTSGKPPITVSGIKAWAGGELATGRCALSWRQQVRWCLCRAGAATLLPGVKLQPGVFLQSEDECYLDLQSSLPGAARP